MIVPYLIKKFLNIFYLKNPYSVILLGWGNSLTANKVIVVVYSGYYFSFPF